MKHVLLALFLCLGFFATAQTVTIPDPNFKTALLNYDPVIDTNGDGEIQVSEAENTTSLSIHENNIIDMTGIEAFVNLTYLLCFNNLFTTIDLSENINLEQLFLVGNSLTTLDLSNNTELVSVDFSSNELTTLDFSQNISLKKLFCESNQLESLNISSNLNLEILSCGANQLEGLDLSQNSKLEDLYCLSNQLNTLDVSNNPDIITINCRRNQLTSLDVSQNLELWELTISENYIESINLSNNINLDNLRYRSNPVSFLDVSQNINLKGLSIDDTEIGSIDLSKNEELILFTCNNTPISSLDFTSNSNLTGFTCNQTQITSLDLSQNTELNQVQISNTPITSLDLSNNPNLCSVYVESNFDLEYINLQNGNNILLDPAVSSCPAFYKGLLATNNPNLKFICVDDVAFANDVFTETPPQTAFVEDCSLANGDLNTIEGVVQYDVDNDGCNSNDFGAINLLVNTTDGTHNFANRSTETGNYNLTVSENIFTTTVLGLSPYFTLTPSGQTDTFVGFDQTEISDFCITPAFTANDLSISIIPTDVARPGFETTYTLTYENLGTTTLSGDITLEFDESRVSFVSATPLETSQVSNTITWSYNNVQPFMSKSISVDFSVLPPPTNESGDVLSFTATANPVNTDETPDDNVFELNQEVVNSFDPNDKQVVQGSQVLIEKADEYLHYIVRFQNTGTASAVNVRVQDSLHEQLNWTSIKVLDASHDMDVKMVDRKVDFIFNDINLPTEDTDPEASQGYVAYKIKPWPEISRGDVIENTASIYFDFNPAIITNTVSTTYVEELGVGEFKGSNIVLYPNPADNNFTIEAVSKINSIEILNVLGQTIITKSGASNKEQISVSGLQIGNYFVKVTTEEGSQTIRLLKE